MGGARTFADVNPADGTVIAQVAEADENLVDAAVRAASKAVRGEWGRLTVRERAARLRKVADGIEARFDCFVTAEVADTGKPIVLASRLDVPRAAANFRAFADLISSAGLEAFQTETPDGKSALNYAVRKPLGVVGIITPWNLPLLLLTWKAAPALACGNSVGSEAIGRDSGNRDAIGGSDAASRNSRMEFITSYTALARTPRGNTSRSMRMSMR